MFFTATLVSCSGPVKTTVSVKENFTTPAPQTEITYQVFYDELAPYGRWITYPGYGYVWTPNIAIGFQPYSTNGHWAYSNAGWTWVSNYNWGWAPFHYGRWFFEEGYGWLWLPGHEWAPAWVTWGHSAGFYGWAPLAPRIDINVGWNPPPHYWTFVPQEHMTKPNIENYVVDRTTNINIVKNITIINNHNTTIVNNNSTVINNNIHNTVYNTGPHITEVQKVVNNNIHQVTINEHAKPAPTNITNDNITIYKPVIMHEDKQKQLPNNRPVPKNFEQYKQQHHG